MLLFEFLVPPKLIFCNYYINFSMFVTLLLPFACTSVEFPIYSPADNSARCARRESSRTRLALFGVRSIALAMRREATCRFRHFHRHLAAIYTHDVLGTFREYMSTFSGCERCSTFENIHIAIFRI